MKKIFVTAAAVMALMTAGGAAARDRWVGDYSGNCGELTCELSIDKQGGGYKAVLTYHNASKSIEGSEPGTLVEKGGDLVGNLAFRKGIHIKANGADLILDSNLFVSSSGTLGEGDTKKKFPVGGRYTPIGD